MNVNLFVVNHPVLQAAPRMVYSLSFESSNYDSALRHSLRRQYDVFSFASTKLLAVYIMILAGLNDNLEIGQVSLVCRNPLSP